jgi:Uma2 family endonuclease
MTVLTPVYTDVLTPRRLEREAGIEFVDGSLRERTVSIQSSETAGSVLAILKQRGGHPDGWRVFDSSLGYKVYPHDPRKFRKPDVTAVLRSRAPQHNDGFMQIPADLVVEVVSPDDDAYEIETKIEEYLTHGFRLVWIIYPHTRTVLVYGQAGLTRRLHADDTLTGEDVLPGFACVVRELFA